MATKAPIKGQVAQILNERELVINRGSVNGVELGARFAVLDRRGQDITDPETGRPLGSLHRPKVEVKVTRVEEHLSVATTFRYRDVNVGGQGIDQLTLSGFAGLFTPSKYERRYETFRADNALWKELSESESYVKVGDPVEEVVEIGGDQSLDVQSIQPAT